MRRIIVSLVIAFMLGIIASPMLHAAPLDAGQATAIDHAPTAASVAADPAGAGAWILTHVGQLGYGTPIAAALVFLLITGLRREQGWLTKTWPKVFASKAGGYALNFLIVTGTWLGSSLAAGTFSKQALAMFVMTGITAAWGHQVVQDMKSKSDPEPAPDAVVPPPAPPPLPPAA